MRVQHPAGAIKGTRPAAQEQREYPDLPRSDRYGRVTGRSWVAEAQGVHLLSREDDHDSALLAPPLAPPGTIEAWPRVGVTSALDVPWQFWLAGDPTVSTYRRHTPRRRETAPRGRSGG
ncbi:hypothetical protein Adu01nite_92730 [Paractinoplanes durhamensis]|uniref:3-methyladenine DNA glycosylase n=1 Tax=Paractinoplanes durhamensis TaxID=113563 RepID=A0ABQ3ZDJ6_9ACTN|nr:hypothetical protein Adu01nite_92730 [Actinoplanes durhamensis]